MTPRWYRIAMFVFAVVWAALGVRSLADGDYAKGAFDLALGVAWLLMAFFRDRLAPRFVAAREPAGEVHQPLNHPVVDAE